MTPAVQCEYAQRQADPTAGQSRTAAAHAGEKRTEPRGAEASLTEAIAKEQLPAPLPGPTLRSAEARCA